MLSLVDIRFKSKHISEFAKSEGYIRNMRLPIPLGINIMILMVVLPWNSIPSLSFPVIVHVIVMNLSR